MGYETIDYTLEGPVGVLTYNRPRLVNAINTQMVNELIEVGITKEKAIEIVNAMPVNRDELRTFFSKERKQPETDEVDKILEILSKYR